MATTQPCNVSEGTEPDEGGPDEAGPDITLPDITVAPPDESTRTDTILSSGIAVAASR